MKFQGQKTNIWAFKSKEIRKCKSRIFEDLFRRFTLDVKCAPQAGIGLRCPPHERDAAPTNSGKSGRQPDTSP